MEGTITFADFNLNRHLLKALDEMGINIPTDIQKKSFSVIMSGRDVVGIAQTGTGKTLAYLLPTIRMWKFRKDRFPQILIVVPTRELVQQVIGEIEKLAVNTNIHAVGTFGGVNLKKHVAEVLEGLDIIIATPGRLLDLCLHGALNLKHIKKFIIDEVDEMLNLGFLSQLKRVLDFLPAKRQNLMFSATMTEEVEGIIKDVFNNPVYIEATPMGTPLENITQSLYIVPNFNTKINLLKHLLTQSESFTKVLVFASTKKMADLIFEKIEPEFGNETRVIHSNKSQNHRFKSVEDFENGNCRILIATDIVARGIDVEGVSHVINFAIPELAENYIHRIGRTGRAEAKGNSIAFSTEDELKLVENIEQLMNTKIKLVNFPESVEVSEELIPDEVPVYKMKNTLVQHKIDPEAGGAFHDKKDKNKKVNMKVRKAEKMRTKYKKPKTRGQKKRRK